VKPREIIKTVSLELSSTEAIHLITGIGFLAMSSTEALIRLRESSKREGFPTKAGEELMSDLKVDTEVQFLMVARFIKYFEDIGLISDEEEIGVLDGMLKKCYENKKGLGNVNEKENGNKKEA
jgi:hypothetical protein